MVRTEKSPSGKHRYIHTLECKVCNSSYERVGANRTPLPNGYCSKECRQDYFKQTCWVTLQCSHCKESFEIPQSLTRNFCSHKCYWADLKEKKVMMLLSDFIRQLEGSNHPNVIQLLPLLKRNLDQHGDVEVDLDVMKKKMEIK